MHILISGGSGFIGQALVNYFLTQGQQLSVISRNKEKLQLLFGAQVNSLDWSELALGANHCQPDVVINLAGENIAGGLWTQAKKQKLHTSRMMATLQLVDFVKKLPSKPQCFISASGVTIYPPSTEICTEDTEVTNPAGQGFLRQLAWDWEQALLPLQGTGIRVVNLRLAPVLGASGGMLKQLLWPYKLGLGGRLGTGQQPFPWVALPDVVRAVDFIIQSGLSGAVNMVAPELVDQITFAKTLASVLHRPCIFAMPEWLLRKLFGQMAEELLLNGVKVMPVRLLQAGFEFKYPTLAQALGRGTFSPP
ncbi:MAG TPA: TIGR01777 family oxidoreductase [Gammaproteobacteria bacterium]|nr:TIGR01777 family oxidoreductase [Gammaproteobacteria bacterium]